MISHEIHECFIHEYHAILLAKLEDTIEILSLSSDDEIAYRIIIEHDFTSHDHTSSITFWE